MTTWRTVGFWVCAWLTMLGTGALHPFGVLIGFGVVGMFTIVVDMLHDLLYRRSNAGE